MGMEVRRRGWREKRESKEGCVDGWLVLSSPLAAVGC